MNGILDRRPLPVVHVVRLVAARDEERLGVVNRLQDKRVRRGCAILEHQRLDRVEVPKVENVLVVAIGPGGANHHEVAAAGAVAHPREQRVHVGAAAHQAETEARGAGGVSSASRQVVVVLRTRRAAEGRDQKSGRNHREAETGHGSSSRKRQILQSLG
jgi:hypothetical protein